MWLQEQEYVGMGHAALLVSEERDLAPANSTLLAVSRACYSMPPDHGAAVVRTIFENPELKEDWLVELAEVRDRIRANRKALSLALARVKQDRD